jgi:hypothetical protein
MRTDETSDAGIHLPGDRIGPFRSLDAKHELHDYSTRLDKTTHA